MSYVVEGPDGKQSKQMVRKTPPSFGFSKQTQCGVDPFEQVFGSVFFDEDEETKDSAAEATPAVVENEDNADAPDEEESVELLQIVTE